MGSIANPGARVRDRISELPESLISHILSFLDTREAVRTSVLSTEWKKQWTRVPNVKFVGDESPTGIDHVLLFRGSTDIKKFSLSLRKREVPYLENSRLGAWIRAVVWRNVVELYICIAYEGQSIELPQSLLTCKTLKVLKLDSYAFTFNPPTTGCFPSLKVLYVKLRVTKFEKSVFERIFSNCPSNCPLLEDLTMTMANFKYAGAHNAGAHKFNISAPELKMLTVTLHMFSQPVQEESHFYINAPKLVKFDLRMDRLSGYLFQVNANADYKANIYLFQEKPYVHYSGIPILDTISSVKHLFISSDFVFEVLPKFHNLTHLELQAPFCVNYWAHLIKFLRSSPNLEDLVIISGNSMKLVVPYAMFDSPVIVPCCMMFHLKTVTFYDFKGGLNEMAVAEFLLKHSSVLKKMTVSTYRGLKIDEEREIDKKFLMFERGSDTCQVEIVRGIASSRVISITLVKL